LDMYKIEMSIGQIHKLTLEGLGSAGYTWEYDIDGTQNAIEVISEATNLLSKQSDGNLPPSTFNVNILFTITALKKGHVKVHLSHRRLWEKEKSTLREILLDITIIE